MRITVLVLLLGVGVAAVTPVAKTEAVPLADIKLVKENSVPPLEVAAAARNGNKNGASGHRGANAAGAAGDWGTKGGELVAVDIG